MDFPFFNYDVTKELGPYLVKDSGVYLGVYFLYFLHSYGKTFLMIPLLKKSDITFYVYLRMTSRITLARISRLVGYERIVPAFFLSSRPDLPTNTTLEKLLT